MLCEHAGEQLSSSGVVRVLSVDMLSVQDIRDVVARFASERGAKRVSLFGSYARGEQTPESDIDLLLDKGAIYGLEVIAFQEDLAELLGKRVDVVTTAELTPRLSNRIQRDEVELYVA